MRSGFRTSALFAVVALALCAGGAADTSQARASNITTATAKRPSGDGKASKLPSPAKRREPAARTRSANNGNRAAARVGPADDNANDNTGRSTVSGRDIGDLFNCGSNTNALVCCLKVCETKFYDCIKGIYHTCNDGGGTKTPLECLINFKCCTLDTCIVELPCTPADCTPCEETIPCEDDDNNCCGDNICCSDACVPPGIGGGCPCEETIPCEDDDNNCCGDNICCSDACVPPGIGGGCPCYPACEYSETCCNGECIDERDCCTDADCDNDDICCEFTNECYDPLEEGGCGCASMVDTCFARDYDSDQRCCFIDGEDDTGGTDCGATSTTFGRWGWTNGPYDLSSAKPRPYDWSPGDPDPLFKQQLTFYCGAGQCDISKGFDLAHKVHVKSNGIKVRVKWSGGANSPWELHLGCGVANTDPTKPEFPGVYAFNPGPEKYTVAPGKYAYPVSSGITVKVVKDSILASCPDLWVIVHTCGME